MAIPHKVDHDSVPAYLSWKDLTVVADTTKVLHSLSGVAEPGRLLAVMGPSGCGKSTLLNALGGRLAKTATVTGDVMLNGRKAKLSYGTAAYLAQEVPLLGTLTVYETVYFSAKLRFPDNLSEKETKRIVEDTIADVGLTRSIHTPIGSWHRRGISGGEKRRVSIAIELLTSPRLIFLDEPTSGLDSASAYHVVSVLKKLAESGRTVISSIHQPSSEVFDIFDDLCLLSGGKQVYFGPLPGALQFFDNRGLPCPHLRNPADHYLLFINSDFDERVDLESSSSEQDIEKAVCTTSLEKFTVTATVKTLTDFYLASNEKGHIDRVINKMSTMNGPALVSKGSQASFITQSYILTKRSTLNMIRDVGYYWIRLLFYAGLCVAVGTVFFDVGYKYNAIQARGACLSFSVSFLTFMAVGGFPSFVEDMKVFGTERLNGHYGVGAFVVGNTISCIPFLFLLSIVSSTITYFLVGLHSGVEHFLYFVLLLFACLLVAESLMMAVASLTDNFLIGIILGSGIQGLFILSSGFYRLLDNLPKPFWRYPMSYIAYQSFAFQGFIQNDFDGLQFENKLHTEPMITSDYILRHNYDVRMNHSKWFNMAIVFCMAAGYRMIFCVLIKGSEIVFPAARAFIYKQMTNLQRK